MLFIAGIIVGLLIAVIVFLTVAFFKAPIQQAMNVAEKNVANIGPRPRGFIFEPEDEAEIARREHIAENNAQGKDTPLSELQ